MASPSLQSQPSEFRQNALSMRRPPVYPPTARTTVEGGLGLPRIRRDLGPDAVFVHRLKGLVAGHAPAQQPGDGIELECGHHLLELVSKMVVLDKHKCRRVPEAANPGVARQNDPALAAALAHQTGR